MAILTISKLLNEAGLDTTKRIKLLRHKDNRKDLMIEGKPVDGNPYEWYIKDRQKFIAYQSEQSEALFKDVDYIVSFIGEEGTTARMVGVYRILGLDQERIDKVNNGHFYYKMAEVSGFEELNERVIIDWGKSTITWHQWLHKNDKEVVAIERKGIDWVCPDYEEIILSYEQLQRIFKDQISVWKNKLSSSNCIYVISDSKSGSLYVGSTYNREGIWGRWKDYASTGHGGDVELIKLLEADPEYSKKYFTWAILQVLPLGIQDEKAIHIETLWKNKLGRSACSLNKN
ncbi:MAG: GIY-YIG nuclease family protein [Bacteroidales bacterium]|nr:GIY-YIG nuclease family protein [Bacteroidales bacterium]